MCHEYHDYQIILKANNALIHKNMPFLSSTITGAVSQKHCKSMNLEPLPLIVSTISFANNAWDCFMKPTAHYPCLSDVC